MFSYEHHRRHPELTTVAVHPGMVRTDVGRHLPRIQVAMYKAMSLPTDDAAKAGVYYDRFDPAASSPASYDKGAAQRLGDVTEELRGPFDQVG